MSVVGIDFGNLQAVIAVARNRGIDVICNEVSNRATPSLVSFNEKQRFLGESAKTLEISNAKNTVGCLKRLAGRKLDDPETQTEKDFIMADLAEVDGQAGVKVMYLGETAEFTNIQLLAMFLTKAKNITAAEIKAPVSDCVITVPGWFTEVQRRAMLAAAEVAGLNCLRLVNDLTAAALGYGITKLDLPEDKPRHVAFVDIGHSSYSVAIVAFMKGKLTVLGTAYDRHFGGREFDKVIVDKLAEHFKEKYKIDVFSNKKALLRLRTTAEKCKKILSANPVAPVNIESIMDDRDVSANVERKDFEEWAEHLFKRTEDTLVKALENAKLTVGDVDFVEMVGGSTRIPAIKKTIAEFFGKEISTTLNQDEAVSRGAALQCAMLSPVFKVRDFEVNDICSYPVKFSWDPAPEEDAQEDETEIVVFSRGNSIPSTKILTFHRSKDFSIEATYATEPRELPGGIGAWIAKFDIKDVKPVNGEPAQIKVKARLNIHGILEVKNAYTVEQKEVEEEVTNKDGEKEIKKTKKLVKTSDLRVVASHSGISQADIEKLKEQEGIMASTDALVMATEAAKNSLEEYGYDMRDKVNGPCSEFIDPAIKDKFVQDLGEVTDWIYDEGDDAPKSEYVSRLQALKAIGDPVIERFREAEERPRAVRAMRATINDLTKEAMSGDEKYSHIPAHEKQDIVERAERAIRWLDEQLSKQEKVKKYEAPVLFGRDIEKEEKAVETFANQILSKPKPVPKPATPENDDNTMEEKSEADEESKDEDATTKTSDMDVD